MSGDKKSNNNHFLSFFQNKKNIKKPIVGFTISSPSINSTSSEIPVTPIKNNLSKDDKTFKMQESFREFFKAEKSFLERIKTFKKQINEKNTKGKDYLADIIPENHLTSIEKIVSRIIETSEQIIKLNNSAHGALGFDSTEAGFDFEKRAETEKLILKNQTSIQELSIIIKHMNEIYGLDVKINGVRKNLFPELFQRPASIKNLVENMEKRCATSNLTEVNELTLYFEKLYESISRGMLRFNNSLKFEENSISNLCLKKTKKNISSGISLKENKVHSLKRLKDKQELDNILTESIKRLHPNTDVESRLQTLQKLQEQATETSHYCAPPKEVEKQELFDRRLTKIMSEIKSMKEKLEHNDLTYDYNHLDRSIAKITSGIETLKIIIDDEGFLKEETDREITTLKSKKGLGNSGI